MRPRTLGKIVIGVLTFCALVMSFLYATTNPSQVSDMYQAFRGISYGLMALTFATLYKYFED